MPSHASSQSDALPAPVGAAASAHQLGAHKRTFAPQRVGTGLVVLMFAGVLVGFALFLLPGVLLLWRILTHSPNFSRKQAAKRLHLFNHGLIVSNADGPADIIRYDSVTVFAQVISQRVNGVHTGTFYTYRLPRPDGSDLKLTQFYAAPEQWGQMIQHGVANAQFPIAAHALTQGRRVQFGDLALDQAGVTTPAGTCPWHEIRRVDVVNGVLVLGTRATASWWHMPVRRIPNFPVAVLLMRQFRRG